MSALVAPASEKGRLQGTYEQGRQWKRVKWGRGCSAELSEELRLLGVERPFLLSTGSLERSGLLAAVRKQLATRWSGESAACRAHVPESVAEEIAAEVAEAGADGIVALGGSSVIDGAKAVALLLALPPGESRSLAQIRAAGDPPTASLPIVALPTTLSGGEFTGVVATTDAAGVKHLMLQPSLAPCAVLLDPQLTTATPEALWRSTGMKTLSDAVEQIAYGAGPVTDALCARSIELFAGSLMASSGEGEARLRCQLAAWLSLFGLHDGGSSVGLGAALRHQVAVTFGVGHGEVTCVLLPHVVRFNATAIPERAPLVAGPLGIVPGEEPGEALWMAVAERLADFVAELGLPGRLREIVDRDADLFALAGRVLDESAAAKNPRPVSSPDELVRLLQDAW